MPTGVHIRDPRDQLFTAAERVLQRSGASGLTSRAVTDEAGVAKGVLHRHFADFDAFLVELVRSRIDSLRLQAETLLQSAGVGTVADNLVEALLRLFDPVAVQIVALVVFRDELRSRLRSAGSGRGIPILTEAAAMLAAYLADERALGRIAADADVDSLALALIGAGHVAFADSRGVPMDVDVIDKVVAATVADVVQRRLL